MHLPTAQSWRSTPKVVVCSNSKVFVALLASWYVLPFSWDAVAAILMRSWMGFCATLQGVKERVCLNTYSVCHFLPPVDFVQLDFIFVC